MNEKVKAEKMFSSFQSFDTSKELISDLKEHHIERNYYFADRYNNNVMIATSNKWQKKQNRQSNSQAVLKYKLNKESYRCHKIL